MYVLPTPDFCGTSSSSAMDAPLREMRGAGSADVGTLLGEFRDDGEADGKHAEKRGSVRVSPLRGCCDSSAAS